MCNSSYEEVLTEGMGDLVRIQPPTETNRFNFLNSAEVLYDKPPESFQRTSYEESHRLMQELERSNDISQFFNLEEPAQILDSFRLSSTSLIAAEYKNVCWVPYAAHVLTITSSRQKERQR